MKESVRFFGILTLLQLVLAFQAKTQVYPVQLNTQLTPPYSLKLSDYVAPGTNRVGLNMILTDLNEPEYYVRLELTIEGDGITLKTSPTFNPGPVILEGGVPQFLTSSDLAAYFNPQNLDFSGYSKSDYLANGRLPEGVYRFSFRAYDYNKSIRVSNNSSTTAWLLLNEPPIINLPLPGHKVEHIDPQNIVFQWTPRHTGSPNSAFTTEYEFTLVEIWPEGRDPNNAIETSIPVYQTTTTNSSLVYGLSEPFLEPGRKYAYRIQARDMEERDMFKNQGYTEVRMFTFGDECKPVSNITADAYRFNEAEISWQPAFTQTAFSVRYRKANDPDAEWFEEETFIDHMKIKNLEEATEYEYQVMGYCGTYEGDYTESKTFTTPVPNIADFECGAGDDGVSISNHEPLPVLKKGDYIHVGNFMVKVAEATGSNGTFSGQGFAMIPYLGFVKLLVEFENIKVNTDNQVWDGEISSVYVPDSPFFVDLDETFGEDDEDDDTDDSDDDGDDSGDGTDDTEINDTTLNTVVDSVYIVDDEDIIIIIDDDGTTDTIPNTDDIIITDDNGDTWVVDDGVVIAGSKDSGTGAADDPGDSDPEENNNENTLIAGIKFNNTVYHNDDIIEIPYEYENEIILTAVNSSGNEVDSLVNWSCSEENESQITLAKEEIPLSGINIIANVENDEIMFRLVAATSPEIDVIDGELQIGPLSINLDSRRNRDRSREYFDYIYDDVSFTLNLGDTELGNFKTNISGAVLQYRELRATDEIISATIEWNSEEDQELGDVGIFKTYITGLTLSVDDDGKLSGSIDLKTNITEDKYLSEWVRIRKGLNANFAFNYEASDEGFLGEFDFSSISGINIELIKGANKKVIAKLQNASINDEYLLKGTVKQVMDANFKQGNLSITVDDLSLNAEYGLKEKAFKMKNGSGKLTVSGILGTKGKVKLKLTYDQEDVIADIDADNFDLSAFGMKITPDRLNLEFNQNFEFKRLVGSNIVATHDQITGDIKIDKFEVIEDELKEINLNGELSYKGLQFELKGCQYTTGEVTWAEATAKIGENKINVYSFKIDSDGNISCNSIKGDISKGNMGANIDVSVGESEFSGTFSGSFLKAGIGGTVIFGTAEKPEDAPSYNESPMFSYGYFSLTAQSNSGVPIAPGLKLTKIGGMFGYNAWLTTYNPPNIRPEYNSYIAGLSLGISDMAGIIDLEVDPAIVQFGNDKLEIDVTAGIKMPVKKPLFAATGNVKYEYPSNRISGYLQTSIKVPNSTGFVIKTIGTNRISFDYQENSFKLESSGLHAKMFTALDLTGYIGYEIKKDAEGNTLLKQGTLDASLGFQFNRSWSGGSNWGNATYNASLAVDFTTGIKTSFDHEGFNGTFYGVLSAEASGSLYCNWFNYGATIEGSFEATGSLNYINKQASLYGKFEVDLKCYNNNNPDDIRGLKIEKDVTIDF